MTPPPRTLTVRECSCADPNKCGQACGSEMVDRPYVEASAVDALTERVQRLQDALDALTERVDWLDPINQY